MSYVQLNNVDHGSLLIRTEREADLGDAVMTAPVFPSEFRNLQPHYPIVFGKDGKTGGFRPLALFGLEEGKNLFLTQDGWDAAYIPLSMRMQPFLIGFNRRDGERQLEVHLDMSHPRVTEAGGVPVFLEQGGYTDYLREVSEILGEVHEGEGTVAPFCALLDELGLIEPFSLDVTLNDGTTGRLAGYYVIAEDGLYALPPEALGRLQAAGALLPVFMAVASMSQFRALVARANAALGERR